MRLNFFLMVSLIVLFCHNTQITAIGASNAKLSCAQRLLVPIGDKSVLAEGVLEEIASAYADAIWTSIVEIHKNSSGLDGATKREEVYIEFKEKVMNELKRNVYHEFVANLRSKHFLLGRYDRASNAIQELGVSQWGADLVLGMAIPVSVIGASLFFYSQGDLRLAYGLPVLGATIGVFLASSYSAENRIHSQSKKLSLQFQDMVTEKLWQKLKPVFPEEKEEVRKSLSRWAENGDTRAILNAVFLYFEYARE
ncbi:MAG: hypothetical protein IPJ71_02220 [Bdellovibrionales bacterium]|nr:hypothetical protein [Bdellovibrionales bacterium]